MHTKGRDDMALEPIPQPDETLTRNPTPPEPPEKPPEPSLSALFPERRPYCCPDNPFAGPTPKETEETYKRTASKLLGNLRTPFICEDQGSFVFNGNNVGLDLSPEHFDAAVTTVIAAVECGYHPSCNPTPLDPRNWARLACALTTAIGRGYNHQNTDTNESTLERIQAETTDPDPLTP